MQQKLQQDIIQFAKGLNSDLGSTSSIQSQYIDGKNIDLLNLHGDIYTIQKRKGNLYATCSVNAKTYPIALTKGFDAKALKVFGDIAYIVSYNKDTGETEIGTFPSPDWGTLNTTHVKNVSTSTANVVYDYSQRSIFQADLYLTLGSGETLDNLQVDLEITLNSDTDLIVSNADCEPTQLKKNITNKVTLTNITNTHITLIFNNASTANIAVKRIYHYVELNNTSNLNCVYSPLYNLVKDTKNGELSFKPFRTKEFGYDISSYLSMVLYPAYDNTVNIIIGDSNKTPLRLINSRFRVVDGRAEIGVRKGDYDTNIYDERYFYKTKLFKDYQSAPTIKFEEFASGGELKAGNYQFFLRYTTADGIETDIAASSFDIPLREGENEFTSLGIHPDETTDKAIKLKINNLDEGFYGFVLYVAKYNGLTYSTTSLYRINYVYTIDGPEKVITITGAEDISALSAEEFTLRMHNISSGSYIDMVNNRLVIVNTKYQLPISLELEKKALKAKLTEGRFEIEHAGDIFDENKKYHTENNYANPQFTYNKTGYWKGESYEIGVVFGSESGESAVYPIQGIYTDDNTSIDDILSRYKEVELKPGIFVPGTGQNTSGVYRTKNERIPEYTSIVEKDGKPVIVLNGTKLMVDVSGMLGYENTTYYDLLHKSNGTQDYVPISYMKLAKKDDKFYLAGITISRIDPGEDYMFQESVVTDTSLITFTNSDGVQTTISIAPHHINVVSGYIPAGTQLARVTGLIDLPNDIKYFYFVRKERRKDKLINGIMVPTAAVPTYANYTAGDVMVSQGTMLGVGISTKELKDNIGLVPVPGCVLPFGDEQSKIHGTIIAPIEDAKEMNTIAMYSPDVTANPIKYSTIFDYKNVGVKVTKFKHNYEWINNAADQIYGIKFTDIKNEEVTDVGIEGLASYIASRSNTFASKDFVGKFDRGYSYYRTIDWDKDNEWCRWGTVIWSIVGNTSRVVRFYDKETKKYFHSRVFGAEMENYVANESNNFFDLFIEDPDEHKPNINTLVLLTGSVAYGNYIGVLLNNSIYNSLIKEMMPTFYGVGGEEPSPNTLNSWFNIHYYPNIKPYQGCGMTVVPDGTVANIGAIKSLEGTKDGVKYTVSDGSLPNWPAGTAVKADGSPDHGAFIYEKVAEDAFILHYKSTLNNGWYPRTIARLTTVGNEYKFQHEISLYDGGRTRELTLEEWIALYKTQTAGLYFPITDKIEVDKVLPKVFDVNENSLPSVIDLFNGDNYLGVTWKKVYYPLGIEATQSSQDYEAFYFDRSSNGLLPQSLAMPVIGQANYNPFLRVPDKTDITNKEKFNKPKSYIPVHKYLKGDKQDETTLYNEGYKPVARPFDLSTLPQLLNYILADFPNRVYVSNKNSSTSQVNNFSLFMGSNFRDYDPQYGPIRKVISHFGYTYLIFDNAISLIKIDEEKVLADGTVDRTIITKNEVLSKQSYHPSTAIGSTQPDSVIASIYFVYGVDINAQKIWRIEGNKLVILSDMIVSSILSKLLDIDKENEYIKVHTSFNKKKGDVIFTFEKYSNQHELLSRESLIFNEKLKLWITRDEVETYSYVFDINQKTYMLKSGDNNMFEFGENKNEFIIGGSLQTNEAHFTVLLNKLPSISKTLDYIELIGEHVLPDAIEYECESCGTITQTVKPLTAIRYNMRYGVTAIKDSYLLKFDKKPLKHHNGELLCSNDYITIAYQTPGVSEKQMARIVDVYKVGPDWFVKIDKKVMNTTSNIRVAVKYGVGENIRTTNATISKNRTIIQAIGDDRKVPVGKWIKIKLIYNGLADTKITAIMTVYHFNN